MAHVQGARMGLASKKMKADHSTHFMSRAEKFETDVTQDQAKSVFLTANARLLSKAKAFI